MSPNELQELETISRTLNAESNELNTIISAFNAKLATLNVGLEEWLSPDEDHNQIGYAKVNDQWQLAVRYCEEIDWVLKPHWSEDAGYEPKPGTRYDVTPLLQASRELRVRALEYMDALIGNLTQNARGRLKSIKSAKKLVATL